MGNTVSSVKDTNSITYRLKYYSKIDPDRKIYVFYNYGAQEPHTQVTSSWLSERLRHHGFQKGYVIANTLSSSPECLITNVGIVLKGKVNRPRNVANFYDQRMNFTNLTESISSESNSIFDSKVYILFVTLNYIVVSPVIGVFGIVTNIINIVNFRRQGYQDGINVTLTALSISDIGSLVVGILSNIIANPWLKQPDLIIVQFHLMILLLYIHG
ncbi:hypothetical protein Btru_070550 [Bulinus truncatus]|nr:hypothetical protein Btru_070550 [Bulinus truncatus]